MRLLGLLLCVTAAQDAARDEACARQLARSVDLFTLYGGEPPRSLGELVRKPDRIRFWPEGGFWTGPLPGGASLKGGKVACGTQAVEIAPPEWTPVVPPTDRLRAHYTARIRLQLARAAVEAHLRVHAKLPTPAELGELAAKPMRVELGKDRLRLSVEVPAVLWDALTPDEAAALEKAASLAAPGEELRAIGGWLDRMSDDDYETRLEAAAELRRRGSLVRGPLQERLRSMKDPEVRGRLAKLAPLFAPRPPAWKTELRPLATVVLSRRNPAGEASCADNLRQLWMMENVYMSQFGGRMKSMPKETGKDFWLALTKTEPPLLDPDVQDILVCPASGLQAGKGACSYAGPAQNVGKLAHEDVVGLCDDEGHGDSVILLRKSGDVVEMPREGAEHQAALKTTKR
jgi:hypothetical protein